MDRQMRRGEGCWLYTHAAKLSQVGGTSLVTHDMPFSGSHKGTVLFVPYGHMWNAPLRWGDAPQQELIL